MMTRKLTLLHTSTSKVLNRRFWIEGFELYYIIILKLSLFWKVLFKGFIIYLFMKYRLHYIEIYMCPTPYKIGDPSRYRLDISLINQLSLTTYLIRIYIHKLIRNRKSMKYLKHHHRTLRDRVSHIRVMNLGLKFIEKC